MNETEMQMDYNSFYPEKIQKSKDLPIPSFIVILFCHLVGAFLAIIFTIFLFTVMAYLFSDVESRSQQNFLALLFFVIAVWSLNAIPRLILRKLRRIKAYPAQAYRKLNILIKKNLEEIGSAAEKYESSFLLLAESNRDREETSGTVLWMTVISTILFMVASTSLYRYDGHIALIQCAPFYLALFIAPLLAKRYHWSTPIIGLLTLTLSLDLLRLPQALINAFFSAAILLVLAQFLLTLRHYLRRPLPRVLLLSSNKQAIVTLPQSENPTIATEITAPKPWKIMEEPAGGYSILLPEEDKFTLYSPGEVDELANLSLVASDWRKKLSKPSFIRREGLAITFCVLLGVVPYASFSNYIYVLKQNIRVRERIADGDSLLPLKAINKLLELNPLSSSAMACKVSHLFKEGKYKEALDLSIKAKKLAGETASKRPNYRYTTNWSLAGECLRVLDITVLKICREVIELQEKHPDDLEKSAQHLIEKFPKLNTAIFDQYVLFHHLEQIRRKALAQKASPKNARLLLETISHLNEPTISPFFDGKGEKRFSEAKQILEYLEKNKPSSDFNYLSARVHFKFENFKKTMEFLENSKKPEELLLYTSAARYTGKTKEELLKLIGSIGYTSKEMDKEVAKLFSLILAQFGDLSSARALLRRHRGKDDDRRYRDDHPDLSLLEALICSQNPLKALQDPNHPPISLVTCSRKRNPIHCREPYGHWNVKWPLWMSTSDMEYFMFIKKYSQGNLARYSYNTFCLAPLPNKDGIKRLSALEWYPYKKRSKELSTNLR